MGEGIASPPAQAEKEANKFGGKIMALKFDLSVAGVAASVIALAGAPALAQDYSGAFTLGYNSIGEDFTGGDRFNTTRLSGDISVQFPSGFQFGARVDHANLTFSGGSGSEQADAIKVNARYNMQSGAWAGIFSESINVEGFGLSTIGLEGGMRFGNAGIGAFYGTSKFLGETVSNYGISGAYESGPLVAGAYYTRSEAVGEHVNAYGIGGAYQIGTQFAVFAGANRFDSSVVPDVKFTQYGVGGSYDLSNMVHAPMFVSGEYLGLDLEGNKLKGFSLSVTIPLGGQGSMIPNGSVANSVLAPSHGVLGQIF